MSKTIKVIDNFLPQKEYLDIFSTITSVHFPWFFIEKSTYQSKNKLDFHLGHLFYTSEKGGRINSTNFDVLLPLINKMKVNTLVRIKANLQFCSDKIIESAPHIDQEDFNCKNAIYYMNTNDGYTMIENKKVKSVGNRIVFFDNNLKHYGTNCTDEKTRMVLNFNYF